MSRSETECIEDALEHLRILRLHLTRGELDDGIVVDTVILRLAAAIEAVHSGDLGVRLFGEEWSIIWATRNRIAHGYAYIDHDMIRATVERDLPGFEKVLVAALGSQ